MVKQLKSEKYKGFEIQFRQGRTQVETKIKNFPNKGTDKTYLVSSKESGLIVAKTVISNYKDLQVIPIGLNQISFDEDSKGWIIEVRQYVASDGLPMYSVWDVVKEKNMAIKLAKLLTPENEYNKHNYYMDKHPEIFTG